MPTAIVSGLLRDGLGLGQAARAYGRALVAGGFAVRQHVVALPGRPVLGDPGPSGLLDYPEAAETDEADLVVVCLHPPELALLGAHDVRLPAGRMTVAAWAWEVDPAPADWAHAPVRVDEIWVHSTYSAALLAEVAPAPVVTVPPPVDLGPARIPASGDGKTFLTLADGASTFARKNPLGAIHAFTRAFEPDAGHRLVVKVWNGHADRPAMDEVRRVAAARPDIEVQDRWLRRDRFLELLRSADALVSLHRAEGFGLPVFEALAHEVPVVLTGFSGPMDLVDERHAFLVSWRGESVPRSVGPYPKGALWAEPDLDHAAELLRIVAAGPEVARRRAAAGRAMVRARLSPEAVGRSMRERFDRLQRRHVARSPRSPRSPLRPTTAVVAHAAEPWPAVASFLSGILPQLGDGAGELVLGVAGPQVLPEPHRPPGVRVVDVGSTSPFALRAGALATCDAELVVVTEDHCRPAPGWLAALVDAHHEHPEAVLAGPVGNGATATRVDWANYLMGFAAYAPPLLDTPADRCPTPANCAVPGALVREALGARPAPGALERDLLPAVWRAGAVTVVPEALVHHAQAFPAWLHLRNHFDDARVAGAHRARDEPAFRPAFTPGSLRRLARQFLREVVHGVTPRHDLVAIHAEVGSVLRALALARAVGLAAGARWGPGASADRLD